MFPFKTDVQFSSEQILKLVAAMLFIANVDVAGTAEEVAMIQKFYDGFRDDLPAFGTIEASPPLPGSFPEAEQREILMATCVMVAFADGVMSDNELKAVKNMAEKFDITEEKFEELLSLVKDYMLMQLAGLPDTDSVIKVARELG